ncbi:hypothetical protein CBL_10376 [Carabus blaptoides fortunei]
MAGVFVLLTFINLNEFSSIASCYRWPLSGDVGTEFNDKQVGGCMRVSPVKRFNQYHTCSWSCQFADGFIQRFSQKLFVRRRNDSTTITRNVFRGHLRDRAVDRARLQANENAGTQPQVARTAHTDTLIKCSGARSYLPTLVCADSTGSIREEKKNYSSGSQQNGAQRGQTLKRNELFLEAWKRHELEGDRTTVCSSSRRTFKVKPRNLQLWIQTDDGLDGERNRKGQMCTDG